MHNYSRIGIAHYAAPVDVRDLLVEIIDPFDKSALYQC
jgi:hypothetical protein